VVLNNTTVKGTFEASANPAFSTSDSSAGWTRTLKDSSGRVVETDYISGSGAPYPWSTTTPTFSTTACATDASACTRTNYAGGYQVAFTDELNTVRQQTFGGAGRLTQVVEDPTGLNYTTGYTYDLGDRLLSVTQSGANRTFTYSSLGRLVNATNPEVSASYTYDKVLTLRQ